VHPGAFDMDCAMIGAARGYSPTAGRGVYLCGCAHLLCIAIPVSMAVVSVKKCKCNENFGVFPEWVIVVLKSGLYGRRSSDGADKREGALPLSTPPCKIGGGLRETVCSRRPPSVLMHAGRAATY
jgi:hypothetical protein